MAELFLAQDGQTNDLVVLKRILPYLSQEAEFVRMFLDEARIAAQLHHPNIIQVHELGKLQDSIFMSMEFVEGVDVRKLLQEEQKRGGVIPADVAAYVTAQVCAGLAYAHNSNGVDGRPLQIVHRDISPQNVMVSFDGEVKLVDFGIAKAGAFMERSKPGVIKGKFLYLSPEQLSQERLDHRADLFAVGTMLYELTLGRSPFHRTTTEAVIYAIRHDEPVPPVSMRPDYPAPLQKIVLKCLTKDRTKRYQSALEIQRDLLAFLKATDPVGARGLAEYVAKLLGTEDDATIMQSTDSSPGVSALSMLGSSRDIRVATLPLTSGVRAAALPPNPPPSRKLTDQNLPGSAAPEAPGPRTLPLAQALAVRTPQPAVAPPVRKTGGVQYPSVTGSEERTLTTQGGPGPDQTQTKPLGPHSVETNPPSMPSVLPPESVPPRPRPSLDEAPPLATELTDELPINPNLSQPLAAIDARTANMRSGPRPIPVTPPPPRAVSQGARSPIFIGMIAFMVVLLTGLLALWLFHFSPTPSLSRRRKPPPTDSVPRAAPPDPATEPAPPVPSDGRVRRVEIIFKAPPGTLILHEGQKLVPEDPQLLPPGTYAFQYQCPGKRTVVNATIQVASPGDGHPVAVPLACQSR